MKSGKVWGKGRQAWQVQLWVGTAGEQVSENLTGEWGKSRLSLSPLLPLPVPCPLSRAFSIPRDSPCSSLDHGFPGPQVKEAEVCALHLSWGWAGTDPSPEVQH